MNLLKLYTPEELLILHPNVKEIGWNPSKIGAFFNAHLLQGTRNRRMNKSYIDELSFIELYIYSQDKVRAKMKELNDSKSARAYDLFTPDELIHKYPTAHIFSWDATKIGIFFSGNLLMGFRSTKEHNKALIIEDSFLNLFNYASSLDLRKQIEI
jgi:hypothetical protein